MDSERNCRSRMPSNCCEAFLTSSGLCAPEVSVVDFGSEVRLLMGGTVISLG